MQLINQINLSIAMKKFIAFFAMVAFAASVTSCKKDYTCECTDDDGETFKYEYKKVSKKDAEEACDASSSIWALGGGSCSLK